MTGPDDAYPPISDYGLISDCHGSALVSRHGSIDWCCLPRFDARPVFSRLLDWEGGGHFRIAPSEPYETERRYRPGTNVLETRFRTDSGTLVLTDFMVVGRTDSERGADSDEPHPTAEDRLVRIVRAEEGPVETEVEYRPRFDFGATTPYTTRTRDGLLVTYGGADALVLQVPCEVEVGQADARGRLRVEPGRERSFVLTYALPHRLEPRPRDEKEVRRDLEWTEDFWKEWSERCAYEGRHRDAVVRSALVLKALTNLPTGAIVAAPTTSLPEEIGGVRNWDYRYTWLRDAAHVLDSLFYLDYTNEAEDFMRWLHRTTAGLARQLQIMYGPGGERMLPEVRIEGVEGYRGSRPVRTGNAAARQFQLDIYGDLVRVVWRYHSHGGEVDEDLWNEVRDLIEHVAEQWERPDSGLWEVRSEPDHFVHSKVMVWVALDRGVRLAEDLGYDAEVDGWRELAGTIRRTVLEKGVDPSTGRFLRSFGSPHPDASALLFPLLGFVPVDDERVSATRRSIRNTLEHDGLIRRYRGPDGLPGAEGAFVVCSFWLVEQLALAGEVDEAARIFDSLMDARNDLGLLPEEIDPESGEFLGNFPQALSHIGLINAAVALERAGRAG